MTSLLHRAPDRSLNLLDWMTTGAPAEWFTGRSFIPVEESTHDGTYELRADLPGVDPDRDISITVDHDLLTIKAERREESHGEGRSELRYGTFSRTLRMPSTRSDADVSASYNDGVLTVAVPLQTTSSEQIHIPVTRGEGTPSA